MNSFTSVHAVPDLAVLLQEAFLVKASPLEWHELGKHKTLGLVFLNSSLRTRFSTQRAALNLGMNTLVANVGTETWKLEFQDGAVMNGETVEHIKEGAAVLGSYCDILGVRAFASLTDKTADTNEHILEQFRQYSGRPMLSLESATRHPLQAFADLLTIEEIRHREKITRRPKVVLSWAPHPKALPQAVANSFSEWMRRADVDFVITHPEGYELDEQYIKGVDVTNNQEEALQGADFVYAKNWSSFREYGQVLSHDSSWMITADKMRLTNNGKFMHCLPTRRNVEVADEVLDSSGSLVILQAQNRVVAAQTILKRMLEGLANNAS